MYDENLTQIVDEYILKFDRTINRFLFNIYKDESIISYFLQHNHPILNKMSLFKYNHNFDEDYFHFTVKLLYT